MGEHFVIKNIRRSIKEAQSCKGMIVGLPEIRVPASHAEVLLGEIDRLKAELEEAEHRVATQSSVIIACERKLAEARAEVEKYKAGIETFGTVFGSGRIVELDEAFMRLLNQRVSVLIMTEG